MDGQGSLSVGLLDLAISDLLVLEARAFCVLTKIGVKCCSQIFDWAAQRGLGNLRRRGRGKLHHDRSSSWDWAGLKLRHRCVPVG